jgi:hypothetical protein
MIPKHVQLMISPNANGRLTLMGVSAMSIVDCMREPGRERRGRRRGEREEAEGRRVKAPAAYSPLSRSKAAGRMVRQRGGEPQI